jgi:hypothetical protein
MAEAFWYAAGWPLNPVLDGARWVAPLSEQQRRTNRVEIEQRGPNVHAARVALLLNFQDAAALSGLTPDYRAFGNSFSAADCGLTVVERMAEPIGVSLITNHCEVTGLIYGAQTFPYYYEVGTPPNAEYVVPLGADTQARLAELQRNADAQHFL